VRIAYLVNQYPRGSHSFIRREILAVEAEGVEVLRYSLRPLDQPLTDEADRREAERTRMVLATGVAGHAHAVAAALLRSPLRFLRAVALAARVGFRSDRGLVRNLVYLAEACVLERWLRAARADHLHVHFGTNAATVALLCHALGGPGYSVTVHGSEEFDKPEALRLDEKVGRARFAVAISSFGRAQLWRWVRAEHWPKVHVVRCALDAQVLGAARADVPAAPRLVCVARLTEGKGHPLLLEAAARLRDAGTPVELVLAGDGPLRGQLEAQVRAAGLEAQVRFAGWLAGPQIREAVLASRALVLPSFMEGLPVVVMEALALGRPAIVSAVAGVPELIQEGVSGWMVPAGDVDALVEAMRAALAATPERLAEMGRAGAAYVARAHDGRTEARKLVALFRAAVEGGDAPVVAPAPERDGRDRVSA
jgi:glycosyltransferase involved in cell wall biosynthesis